MTDCTAPRNRWGEPKRARALSLTDSCWELLSWLASQEGAKRSEYIERLVRTTYDAAP